ncbi:MAG: protease inhibitor I42 family protein [Chloroflexi bacterium]|nr:protease inhibitor I42 family protein [Chloroflexota bacterium]
MINRGEGEQAEAPELQGPTVAGPGVVDRSADENVDEPSEDEHITLVSDEFEPAATSGQEVRFGEMGTRRLTFRVNHPGRYTLRLVNRRPWQANSASAEVFEVDLEVQPKRTGDSDQGLSERQKPLLALAA